MKTRSLFCSRPQGEQRPGARRWRLGRTPDCGNHPPQSSFVISLKTAIENRSCLNAFNISQRRDRCSWNKVSHINGRSLAGYRDRERLHKQQTSHLVLPELLSFRHRLHKTFRPRWAVPSESAQCRATTSTPVRKIHVHYLHTYVIFTFTPVSRPRPVLRFRFSCGTSGSSTDTPSLLYHHDAKRLAEKRTRSEHIS